MAGQSHRAVGFTTAEDIDERRQRDYLRQVTALWLLIFGFLVLRDPVWRLLHQARLVSPLPVATRGAADLDEDLVSALVGTRVQDVSGNESLEAAIIAGLRRERSLGGDQAVELPPLIADADLSRIARSRAQARLLATRPGDPEGPEFLYPHVYFALLRRSELIAAAEVYAPVTMAELPVEVLAGEVVSGWMNRLKVSDMLTGAEVLAVGVGVFESLETGRYVDLVMLETCLQFDTVLPEVFRLDEPQVLTGSRSSSAETEIYLKGPDDPGFFPIAAAWTSDRFDVSIPWDQGSGNYAIRCVAGQRLSDPLPMVVR